MTEEIVNAYWIIMRDLDLTSDEVILELAKRFEMTPFEIDDVLNYYYERDYAENMRDVMLGDNGEY